MVRKVCKGKNTGQTYIEDEEAAVHQYLNKKFYSSGNKMNGVLPEPMEIKKVSTNDKNTD